MASSPSISGYRRIKRASRACQHCHARKVRCDATVTGFPCTNCRLDSHPCQAFTGGRDRRKQLSLCRVRVRAAESKSQLPQDASTVPTGRSRAVQVRYSSYACIQPLDLGGWGVDEALPILERAGCLDLPDKADLEVLVRHYFLYVHPFSPAIDEAAFWRVYKNPRQGDRLIPLFLFRAMIFSASCFVPAEVANRGGYGSLLDARDDLYSRAKLLFDSGAEKDALTLSRGALLLTYYTSDFDVFSNSYWLRIALQEASIVRETHLVAKRPVDDGERSELKRLWWCCLVRDRIISLGMRRPPQITAEEVDAYPRMLATDDINDEIFGSFVYSFETKSALFELYTSLCHFALAVTDLLTTAFPSGSHARSGVEDACSSLEKLESAKSVLLLWELDWMTYMEGKNASLHPSIPLFSNLLAIYYQSARIALCNRVCLALGTAVSHKPKHFQQLQLCQSELLAAIACIADKVRQLLVIEAVDKLPISVAACTATPYILLTLNSESDRKKSREILVLFTAVNRALGSRYHITRVSNLTSRALWLSQRFRDGTMGQQEQEQGFPGTLSESTPRSNLFTLPLHQYTRLLQYIDESMSVPHDSVQETEILYAAASTVEVLPSKELTPVWLEAMENFFFGPGCLRSLVSMTDLEERREIRRRRLTKI
ncbi:hypothetical protein BJY00DRAFT_324838 [Aspergillus carlsbadensis]|nr:hypothetical protein BJY00DRAFT_324838 [Aspergillus carlsbadensis]